MLHVVFMHPRCWSQNEGNRKSIDPSLALGQTTAGVGIISIRKTHNDLL